MSRAYNLELESRTYVVPSWYLDPKRCPQVARGYLDQTIEAEPYQLVPGLSGNLTIRRIFNAEALKYNNNFRIL